MTATGALQVVPHLPPPEEGVGSFALALGAALFQKARLEARVLDASTLLQSKAALAAALANETTVLLHYANYGYERRGCPGWLIEGLARWKRSAPERRLVTVYHELYASGPPWRSSFWLGPQQRRLASRLLTLSDAAVTSLELQARILRRWRPDAHIDVAPVFSTVGEPAAVWPLAERPRRLIVFGGSGARGRAWTERRADLLATCRALQLAEIWDVGPPAGAPVRLDGLPVRELGVIPPGEVSARLLDGCAGFAAYPSAFLGKSTAFAAYCAHGLLPVCASTRPEPNTEPTPPFWKPRSGTAVRWNYLQTIADQAHAWYRGHSLDRHAAAYLKLLFPQVSPR